MLSGFPLPHRLLSLRDAHGAPLADFDWHPSLDLLQVHWHGHLTAASLVHGAQMGLSLGAFEDAKLPRRLLTNHEQASGSWEEALPWLQYDWLPRAQERGLALLAHVASPDPASFLTQPDHLELAAALRQAFQAKSFRHAAAAWYWLTHR
ncbi:hypothetical protein HHL22_06165 [Hymenobacter sp. RP-2-7]|uniref:Uncharacterized protein n=1 Tax=Hymenobacter polaris TaxID=2682546 RepID=A0A7Y0FLS6_9BACT|nr:hypothetical protein [Hymenobacter polaris]NML64785.1 hypothetical protein [Hymenobacter polaris]